MARGFKLRGKIDALGERTAIALRARACSSEEIRKPGNDSDRSTSQSGLLRPTAAESRKRGAAAFLVHLHQVICPTGELRGFLSSPSAKNILLPFFRSTWFTIRHPASSRGALRPIVTKRGVGCGGRDDVVCA